MKVLSVCLLAALVLLASCKRVVDEREEGLRGRGDVTGLMKDGMSRIKSMMMMKGTDEERMRETGVPDIDTIMRKMKDIHTTTTIPTITVPITELVRGHGYPIEEHVVTTPDGYIITIHRIPHGRTTQQTTGVKRVPVFLQHGLLSSSDSWLMNKPEISLPYLLADAGHDVWLGNVRGNTYGRQHKMLTPEQPEFWNFSWDDIARQDIPSMINYIVKMTDVPVQTIGRQTVTDTDMLNNLLNTQTVGGQTFGRETTTGLTDTDMLNTVLGTRTVGRQTAGGMPTGRRGSLFGKNVMMNPQGKLHYIGHSEGSLLGFVQFGRDKDLASKITVFVALSPMGTIGTTQTPITQLLKNVDISTLLTQPEVMTNTQLRNLLKTVICGTTNVMDEMCHRMLVSLTTPITGINENVMIPPEVLKGVVIQDICGTDSMLSGICKNILTVLTTTLGNIETTMIPQYLTRLPAGTSKKNIMHYLQLAKTGNLQAFDYGTKERNRMFYRQDVPPQYSLKDVTVPVVLLYGNKDLIVGDRDLEIITKTLPNIVHQDLIDTYGHMDFVLGKNAKERVYDKLVKLLTTQEI